MANRINWFEVPVTDFGRAKKFYEEVFRTKLEDWPMDDVMLGVFSDEGVSGAIIKGEGIKPSMDGTLIYFNAGEDLTEVMSRIEPAGGKVLQPKTKVTDEIGFICVFSDTEGNKLALHSRK